MRKITLFDEFLVSVGPIISRIFACSKEGKNKQKQKWVLALVLSLWSSQETRHLGRNLPRNSETQSANVRLPYPRLNWRLAGSTLGQVVAVARNVCRFRRLAAVATLPEVKVDVVAVVTSPVLIFLGERYLRLKREWKSDNSRGNGKITIRKIFQMTENVFEFN
jgi:hypothetical protein